MNKNRDETEEGSVDGAAGRTLSRRKFLKVSMTGAALAGAAGLSACETPREMQTAGTTPKSVAMYRDSPNQGRRCAGCTHFLEPNRCEIVEGEISPNGWCRFHEPIDASMQESQAQPTQGSQAQPAGSSGY
jgi:hypothetical protein